MYFHVNCCARGHIAVWLLLLLSSAAWGQSVNVTGKVTGSLDKTPLPGVTVVIKGTNQGTVTDPTGVYKITAPSGSTLLFSFVGFTPKEVKVGSASQLNVELDENAGTLNEVVVTGYGSQSKKDITGAVA